MFDSCPCSLDLPSALPFGLCCLCFGLLPSYLDYPFCQAPWILYAYRRPTLFLRTTLVSCPCHTCLLFSDPAWIWPRFIIKSLHLDPHVSRLVRLVTPARLEAAMPAALNFLRQVEWISVNCYSSMINYINYGSYIFFEIVSVPYLLGLLLFLQYDDLISLYFTALYTFSSLLNARIPSKWRLKLMWFETVDVNRWL